MGCFSRQASPRARWLLGALLPFFLPSLGAREIGIEGPGAVPAPAVEAHSLVQPARPNLVPGDVETFIDGVFADAHARHATAGMSVAVVKDGAVLIAKGYGLGDEDAAVDPARSLFRLGSISKTFTWVAIMQLAEAGRLSLDDPVNAHLPANLHVPDDGFAEPIRIRHLLTHTPGFEDRALGHLFIARAEDVPTLAEYLAAHRPARVRPPGLVTAYSNYGAALAGAIVASVSGQPFEDYVEAHILAPLGMAHTTFREPLGAGHAANVGAQLRGDFADGLAWNDGRWQRQPFAFIAGIGPAGAASSTAADMARYMLALLGMGGYEEGRILSPKTMAAMQATSFSNAEGLPGLAHGFTEYRFGAYRGIGHGGATLSFFSNMVLVPELGVGIFLSVNSPDGRDLAETLPRLILERYYPAATPAPPASPALAPTLADYRGTYLTNRRPYRGFEKLLIGTLGLTRVSISGDGALLTRGPGGAKRWRATAPDLFAEEGGNGRLAFARDLDGAVVRLSMGYGLNAADKLSFFAQPSTLGLLVLASFLSAVALAIAAFARRARKSACSPQESRAVAALTLAAATWLIYLLFLFLALGDMAINRGIAVFVYPTPLVIAALAASLVAGLATLLSLFLMMPSWRAPTGKPWRRRGGGMALALFAATWLLLFHWGAAGWRL
ncbi:MAG: serine hydrolase domain-containing protein [Pseudomonadota bacterium]